MDDVEDFAEYLSGQAQSDISSFHQFMILYDDSDSAFHLFFEGDEDPVFYLPYVRARLESQSIRSYICGGKKAVMSVRSSIEDGGYNINKCLFFLDRDYDCYLGTQDNPHPQTYLTDYYSIESYLTTDEAAEIILVDMMGMSHADPAYARINARLREARAAFAKTMLPWAAWCLASKARGEKPNLNNARMNRVMTFSNGGVLSIKKNAFQLFRRDIKSDTEVSRSEMIQWIRSIKGQDCRLWIRGKFELWMFETFFVACHRDLAVQRKAEGGRVPRLPSALRERSSFDLFGGRLRVPATLATFLNERLAA